MNAQVEERAGYLVEGLAAVILVAVCLWVMLAFAAKDESGVVLRDNGVVCDTTGRYPNIPDCR